MEMAGIIFESNSILQTYCHAHLSSRGSFFRHGIVTSVMNVEMVDLAAVGLG
jgi:hypothetical protein